MAAVKFYLENREVGLNPHSVAPISSAKLAMVDEVKSDVEAYLADMFERNYYPFEFDLVRLTTVEKMIQASFKYERNVRKAATDFMHSIGARRHEKPGGPTARKEHIDFQCGAFATTTAGRAWERPTDAGRCRRIATNKLKRRMRR